MGTDLSAGQAAIAPDEGQASAAPGTGEGQPSASTKQTTVDGPVSEEVTFFDPKALNNDPNLMAAYKQMQGAFTKKNQSLAQRAKDLELVDAFNRDPRGTIQAYARQYGFNVVQADPNAAKNDDWQPKTWQDVINKAKESLKGEFEPLTKEVLSLKRDKVETYLDSNHPDWRVYESSMVDTLRSHPSLAQDPDLLYRMSVPAEVLEAKATKAALAKLKNSGSAGESLGNKTTSVKTSKEPSGPLSLSDAVAVAKARLAAKGIGGGLG